jgi:peptide/nickel transport system substrate-binding protein
VHTGNDQIGGAAQAPLARRIGILLGVTALVFGACSSTPATSAPSAVTSTSAAASTAPSAAATAAASAAASAAGSTAPSAATGRNGTLIIGTSMGSEGPWDPHVAYEDIYRLIFKSTYDTLVTYNGSDLSKVVADAATDWTTADGQTYTFHLNPAIKFNSGNPLTSADVKWSFTRLENLKGPPSSLADAIDTIDTPDPQTVVIKLKAKDTSFLNALTAVNWSIIDSKTAQANGATDAADAKTTDKAADWFNNNTPGSGPFKMSQYVQGEKVVLVRNDGYWRTAPPFTQILITNVPTEEAQVAAVQRGDIDLTRELRPSTATGLQGNTAVQIAGGPEFAWYLFGMTRDAAIDKAVADPKVQQAIHLALDYSGIQALAPDLIQWYCMEPTYIPAGCQQSEGPKQDIAKAKQLLSDAGYPNGFDTEICTSSATTVQPTMLDYAQKIQADLKAVGINATIDAKENSAFLTKYRAGQCHLVQTITGPPGTLTASQLVDFLPGGLYAKRLKWLPDAPDASKYASIQAQAVAATDPSVSDPLWKQLALQVAVDGPWIPEADIQNQFAANANLTGVDKAFNPAFILDIFLLGRK